MPAITDATVVAQAYDTSGNGGRKIIYTTNKNIFVLTKESGKYRIQKTTDNWSTKSELFSFIASTSLQDGCLETDGSNIFALCTYNNTTVGFRSVKTDGTLTQDIIIDNSQSAMGNVSLAINEAKTELHATWASKNSTYPNSFNIRYAKGTINGDGSVTWGAVEQVTKFNSTAYYCTEPTVSYVNGHPIITAHMERNGSFILSFTTKFTTVSPAISSSEVDANWGSSTVYSGTSYAQSSPSAIFVPQSVNGLANGRIWVAWHGKDATYQNDDNIRVSYSDDSGFSWSNVYYITSNNSTSPYVHSQYVSVTFNKDNEIFFVYRKGTSSSWDLVYSKLNGTVQTDIKLKTVALNGTILPSTLLDNNLSFSVPLIIYSDVSKVGFYGKWTVTTISVTPGDIGQIQDKNNILSYSITTDGEMSLITEKINGTVVNTRTANSGDAITLGLTQAQWDAIRFGRYADATGGKNTLTVEMGGEKWTYTFDKRLATDADILSAVKATQDANEVYLPSVKKQLADAINAKGGSVSASADWLTMIGGLKGSSSGRVLGGVVTSSGTATGYEVLNSTSSYNFYPVTVTGLPFKPKRIVIKPQTTASITYLTEYHYGLISGYQSEQVFVIGYQVQYATNAISVGLKADTKGLSVTNTGFVLPGFNANTVYEWTAYEN